MVRDRTWQIGLVLVLAAIGFAFAGVLADLVTLWTTKADYSHGLLVVLFAVYLLWLRREQFPIEIEHWPDPWGLAFFAVGAGAYIAAERFNIAKEWLEAFALLVCLAGVVVMFCDRWDGLRWAWPALAFLLLTFPLPYSVEQTVSLKLRSIAAQGASVVFQTCGLPSYTEGNIIVIGDTRLEVAEACSGLSMLLVFATLSAAIAFLAKSRPLVDRIAVLVAAVPIAVLCNIIRIVATGLIYHAGWRQLGDAIMHDLFGWAMMPLALGFTWLVLKLIGWVTEPVEQISAEEALGLPPRYPNAPYISTGPAPRTGR